MNLSFRSCEVPAACRLSSSMPSMILSSSPERPARSSLSRISSRVSTRTLLKASVAGSSSACMTTSTSARLVSHLLASHWGGLPSPLSLGSLVGVSDSPPPLESAAGFLRKEVSSAAGLFGRKGPAAASAFLMTPQLPLNMPPLPGFPTETDPWRVGGENWRDGVGGARESPRLVAGRSPSPVRLCRLAGLCWRAGGGGVGGSA
mmetsp:Transcript_8952/g.21157  ORF Transcript_8952/g.21157 Transcript_8952/m.21157 type:complete len:204 (-) Transcript_8952:40-651(-)